MCLVELGLICPYFFPFSFFVWLRQSLHVAQAGLCEELFFLLLLLLLKVVRLARAHIF